ncbi:MAG: bifunctional tetrahydrofolate synthase/dihydrofolate synthase [Pseudomonadales bacterium]|nr:bifunctional tetrahydrofolate synthase/dihydrofolate synthase [Pseudomonadales bacterium]
MSLNDWLHYLEGLHPQEIDLGLERIRQVADRLPLDLSKHRILVVGGTNGKGSCITLLTSILRAAGLRTGSYTSPHLLRYNERVCIDQEPVRDEALCEAFAAVEAARGDISLTYFEFGTLAALLLFSEQALDYLLLEVGLGGRLDAVNIVEPDISLLTNVAMDHMDWLGDTREQIAYEKAGIFRSARPAIYAETDVPETVRNEAAQKGSELLLLGRDFSWTRAEDGRHWHWSGHDSRGKVLSYQMLPALNFALDNAAAVLQALSLIAPDVDDVSIRRGFEQARLPGRFQQFERAYTLILDVAHNPHAAANLARNLEAAFPGRKVRLVIAMLKDKDSAGVISALKDQVSCWYVGEIKHGRGAPAKILYNQLLDSGASSARCFDTVLDAWLAADSDARAGVDPAVPSEQHNREIVVVTGSFYTVTALLEWLRTDVGQGA